MSRNNRRRRGKNRSGQAAQQPEGQQQARGQGRDRRQSGKDKGPAIPKNERGVFDFSEEELAEDNSLKLLANDGPAAGGENKYASFEDYLKDH